MATLAVSFAFPTDTQSFTPTVGASVTSGWYASDGQSGNGCLRFRLQLRNTERLNNLYSRTLTFEDMGVPVGATVTAISSASMWTKCSEWVYGSSITRSDGCTLTPSGGAAIEIAAAGANYSAVTAWAEQSGAGAAGLTYPSNTSCLIQWSVDLRTANQFGGTVAVMGDLIAFTVEYSLYEGTAISWFPRTTDGMATWASRTDYEPVTPPPAVLRLAVYDRLFRLNKLLRM